MSKYIKMRIKNLDESDVWNFKQWVRFWRKIRSGDIIEVLEVLEK